MRVSLQRSFKINSRGILSAQGIDTTKALFISELSEFNIKSIREQSTAISVKVIADYVNILSTKCSHACNGGRL